MKDLKNNEEKKKSKKDKFDFFLFIFGIILLFCVLPFSTIFGIQVFNIIAFISITFAIISLTYLIISNFISILLEKKTKKEIYNDKDHNSKLILKILSRLAILGILIGYFILLFIYFLFLYLIIT